MLISELIEALQNLPGDRKVNLKIVKYVEGNVQPGTVTTLNFANTLIQQYVHDESVTLVFVDI